MSVLLMRTKGLLSDLMTGPVVSRSRAILGIEGTKEPETNTDSIKDEIQLPYFTNKMKAHKEADRSMRPRLRKFVFGEC